MAKLEMNLLHLENVKKAFAVANNTIYFDDNSDYLTALWDICHLLNPSLSDNEIGSKYIEE